MIGPNLVGVNVGLSRLLHTCFELDFVTIADFKHTGFSGQGHNIDDAHSMNRHCPCIFLYLDGLLSLLGHLRDLRFD